MISTAKRDRGREFWAGYIIDLYKMRLNKQLTGARYHETIKHFLLP